MREMVYINDTRSGNPWVGDGDGIIEGVRYYIGQGLHHPLKGDRFGNIGLTSSSLYSANGKFCTMDHGRYL